MYTVAICPVEGVSRYRSIRPLQKGEALLPELFAPLGDSPPIEVGKPAVCHGCGQNLVFRREPEARVAAGGAAQTPGVSGSGAVTTLFAVEHDEAIQSMKEVTPDVYVIVTTRRIVKVDIAALAQEAMA